MDSRTNLHEILLAHAPFDLVPAADLAQISHTLSVSVYSPWDVVVGRNSVLNGLFIVLDGQVDVRDANGTAAASLVSPEAFPLEALRDDAVSDSASCEYVANGPTSVLRVPAAAIAKLRSLNAHFNDFCTRRSMIYQNRVKAISDDLPARSGMSFELARLVTKHNNMSIPSTTSVRAAAALLRRAHAIAVTDNSRPLGVFSRADMINRYLSGGDDRTESVATVMNTSPTILKENCVGFDAILEMSRTGTDYVVVVDKKGCFVGLITEKDMLYAQQGRSNVHLNISSATTDADFVLAANKIRDLARSMIVEGVEPSHMTRMVSSLNDLLVERIIQVEAYRDNIDPTSFCWVALGSEGRHEQTLLTDQDNGLVFACNDPAQLARSKASCRERVSSPV